MASTCWTRGVQAANWRPPRTARSARTAREISTNTTNRQTKKSPSAADALTFNVSGLLAEPAGSVREYLVIGPALNLGPELRQSEGLEGSLKLIRTNRGLVVRARDRVAHRRRNRRRGIADRRLRQRPASRSRGGAGRASTHRAP